MITKQTQTFTRYLVNKYTGLLSLICIDCGAWEPVVYMLEKYAGSFTVTLKPH